MKSKLYLFPVPLGDDMIIKTIPDGNIELLNEVEYIVAENAKTARKWLKQLRCQKPLQDFEYAELNEHSRVEDLNSVFQPLLNGKITA